ncbi:MULTISPECIES: hypothetical protein [unclassified Microcella]|uniref:hypothetical protein n=1 Tax=unclassified Microcella TaxID=2630066 RepID=UPI0006F9C80B|nr:MULTISPECIES: hypothetical protein [unclassified Microcella]KQV25876.1 hypothetical protein ASC54_02575 [Yonghaparkia sp. Root332]KRF33315.1 hypothetical protein ASG83_05055 [Yonghaparkia sp. Soil809]
MTQTHRALAALALLGASVVHLAVAATGPASAVAILLGTLGLAEATGAAAVARGALADHPGALAALLVLPVVVPTGALTIASALERPDLTGALLQPTLLGAALLAFAGALVAASAARRLRATDARTEQPVGPGRPGRPARQAAVLVAAALVTGLVSAPAVASARPDVVPGGPVASLTGRTATEADGERAGQGAAAAEAEDDAPRFAVPVGHEGHAGHTP